MRVAGSARGGGAAESVQGYMQKMLWAFRDLSHGDLLLRGAVESWRRADQRHSIPSQAEVTNSPQGRCLGGLARLACLAGSSPAHCLTACLPSKPTAANTDIGLHNDVPTGALLHELCYALGKNWLYGVTVPVTVASVTGPSPGAHRDPRMGGTVVPTG